ncbi:MAG: class I SAM-dependent methyltransferase [Dehalococcoidia bacterium]
MTRIQHGQAEGAQEEAHRAGSPAAALGGKSPYDVIGNSYRQTRREDARIRAAIWEAIGDATSVVNVGAGTGSYEPPQTLLAVEPSITMIAQRGPNLAPATLTTADRIPLRDKSVDVALAVLTIHWWSDREAAFRELRRVARRAVIFTWDLEVSRTFWLMDYFPEILDTDAKIAVPISWLRETLGTDDVRVVVIPYDCADGFLGAYWRRPEAYLDPLVRSNISAFARLGASAAIDRGLSELARDLRDGSWRHRHQDLLSMDSLDIGYRLVVAEWDA